MVCASVIFIPGGIIVQLIRAWKATRHIQSEVKDISIAVFISFLLFSSLIS